MSAKTSNQPGRRTPLSLSGGITKGGQSHKGGNNANGHNTNLKQDNKNQQHNKTEQQQTNSQKQQQSSDAKDNPTKLLTKQSAPTAAESKIPKPQQQPNSDNTKSQKQGNQNDKKQQLAVEKQQQQNGVSNNHKISGNQSQQNNKEKQQSDNDVKSMENDNKKSEATQEKSENDEKEKNKTQEKPEKDEKKAKSDKKKLELKKDEDNKKKEDKIEIEDKKDENFGTDNKTATIPETESIAKDKEKDTEENVVEQMDVIIQDVAPHQQHEQQKQDTPKSAPPTPKALKESKPPTPNKPTSTKTEKTPQKCTPPKIEKIPQKCTPTKREVTTCIDDFEMEPLNLELSPTKAEPKENIVAGLAPYATSTPGKILLPKPLAKTDVQLAMQPSVTPERPREFSQISGRRAIRHTTDYTPSKFQCNTQFRESYRRINTELDATNTSLNVTVGSEIPNNASFSFFGRGRKRERTPPQLSQSAIGVLKPTEMEISPPKRARMDFFSVVSSPLSLLRNRFSKATLQSSTPVKLQQKLEEKEDDIEVQNVSGVSVHEDIEKSAEEASEYGDASFAAESNTDKIPIEGELEILDNGDKELSLKSADKQISDDGDIKITETLLQPMTGDPTAKNKRCIVM